jgi:HAE1 family hydrophobic/amphiphilic exporter-1
LNLPKTAIKRPIATLMVICIMLILGLYSFTSLPIDLLPKFEFPIAAIITEYKGAAPQEVENMVTKPLEEVLATVQGVENITSITQADSSIILIEFTWGTALDFALLDVREKIDMVKGFLPDGTETPWVLKADPSLMPIVQLSLHGDKEDWELRRIAEDLVKPRLERIENIASVNITGGRTREIQVMVEPELLNHYGVALEQVVGALASENYNISAGTLNEAGTEHYLRAIGQFSSLEEMENLIVSSNPSTVLLKDVATVTDTYQDPKRISSFNGKPSIGLEIQKQADANTVLVSKAIWKAMEQIETALPEGIYTQKMLDQADFITDSISSLVETGIVGAVLAILVLLLFLRNFRSTLVIALSIPISIIATFVLVYFSGMTLNIISLGGIALGIGMMVDSSIVVLENIFRFRLEGKETTEAAIGGTNQVAGAITASTLTTVIVFLPVVFVGGFTSQIFKAMAYTVSFSLLASLLVALTIVPLLSSRLLVKKPKPTTGMDIKENKSNKGSLLFRATALFTKYYDKIESFYARMLPWCLGHRTLIMVLFIGSFLLTFALVPAIGAEFLPSMDEGFITVGVELPGGSALAETEKIALAVQDIVVSIPEVDSTSLTVGGTGDGMALLTEGGSTGNMASLTVLLKDIQQRKRSAEDVAEEIRSKLTNIAGAEFSISAAGSMGGIALTGSPIDIALKGDDLEVLKQLTTTVAAIVEDIPGTREIQTSFEKERLEFQAFVDREKASQHGLSFGQIANSLRIALSGQTATRYKTEGTELDVIVRLPKEYSSSLGSLELISLNSPYGHKVPLLEVSSYREEKTPFTINRYNQVRTASVTAELIGRSSSMAMQDIQNRLANLTLPEGYSIDFEGEQQMMQESFQDLAKALILAIFLVYMIMAAQFESLLHPFIIMFALPQTFTGVALALFLTGRTLNVSAFIGIIMLAGIVVNNGIVLVDYANKLKEDGLGIQEAIVRAGAVRLRPILMTTLTTIIAMLPQALGFGNGAELRTPLATVVMGGLTFSTLLTLIVVPVMYSLLEELKGRVFSRKIRTSEKVIQE